MCAALLAHLAMFAHAVTPASLNPCRCLPPQVRDALGLTYDVSFELSLFDRLRVGWFVVHVTSTPAKIDEAAAASLRVLRGLALTRVTPRELLRARRTVLTRHESEMKARPARLASPWPMFWSRCPCPMRRAGAAESGARQPRRCSASRDGGPACLLCIALLFKSYSMYTCAPKANLSVHI